MKKIDLENKEGEKRIWQITAGTQVFKTRVTHGFFLPNQITTTCITSFRDSSFTLNSSFRVSRCWFAK